MGTKNVPTMILDIAIFVGIFCPYNVGFTRSPTHPHTSHVKESLHYTFNQALYCGLLIKLPVNWQVTRIWSLVTVNS